MSSFEHIVVFGSNGRFGRVFAEKLAPAAARLTGIDLDDEAASAFPGGYVRGSLESPDAALRTLVAEADCIVLCVPEAAVLAGLGGLLETARADACIADIASVKSRIAARVADLGGAAGYLGLHPMFAPSEQLAGRNLVVVRIRESAATAALEVIVGDWQMHLSVLSAEEHDRLTATIQAVPHAALLAFGAALDASGVEIETARRLATPVHETLLGLLARMLGGSDETYWSIQADNPYAAEARARLAAALAELDSMANGAEASAFGRWLERISGHLGGEFDALSRRSQRIVEAVRGGGGED